MRLLLGIYSLETGGAERVLSLLANHWASQGHDVTLLTAEETSPFYPLDPGVSWVAAGTPCNSRVSSLKRIFNLLRFVRTIRQQVKKADVVVSFMFHTNILILLAGLFLKKPIIVSERTNLNVHKISFLESFLCRFLYRYAAQVVCQTRDSASYYKNLPNIAIVPNAVAPAPEVHHVKDKGVRIVSVGRLDAIKDQKTLLKAFSFLQKKYPYLSLYIYGEGPMRASLENCIAVEGLKNLAFFPGAAQNVYAVLKKADLFVFPSLYEGFPNALGEAMASGLPVIASDCSGNRELVVDRKNGRLFPVGDVERLREVMEDVLLDAQQRERLGKEARQVVSTFAEERIFQQWDNLLMKSLLMPSHESH